MASSHRHGSFVRIFFVCTCALHMHLMLLHVISIASVIAASQEHLGLLWVALATSLDLFCAIQCHACSCRHATPAQARAMSAQVRNVPVVMFRPADLGHSCVSWAETGTWLPVACHMPAHLLPDTWLLRPVNLHQRHMRAGLHQALHTSMGRLHAH